MNYNELKPTTRRLIVCLIIIACLLAIAAIVFLKRASGKQPIDTVQDDVDNRNISVPNTTVDTTIIPVGADTVVKAEVSDTILGVDKREPYEAGYEDGYMNGCDDGAAEQEKASYDETCSFSRKQDAARYVEGYREGYTRGYEDGAKGKQFNI